LEELDLSNCIRITDVSCLQNCRALKKLKLSRTKVTDAGIRGLELIPTLEELSLAECKQLTDVSCLQSCRALKKLDLMKTGVTDAGVRGLDLIPTLELLNLQGCDQVRGAVRTPPKGDSGCRNQ
jgi:Leucine-rich repeat (LRR) protein